MLPDQHTKLSTTNTSFPFPLAPTQRRFNNTKQQAQIPGSNIVKPSSNNGKENIRPSLQQTQSKRRILIKAYPQQKQTNNKNLFAKYPNLTETKLSQEGNVKTSPEIQNAPINPLSPTPNFVWYDSVTQDSPAAPDLNPTPPHGQKVLPLPPPAHYLGRWVSRPAKPRWSAQNSYQPGSLPDEQYPNRLPVPRYPHKLQSRNAPRSDHHPSAN